MPETIRPPARPPARAPLFPPPPGIREGIVLHDVLHVEERMWVPQGEGVAFLPLALGVTEGYYVNLLRVRQRGVLSCHRHTGAVHAQVLRGRWYYLEHDWVAEPGTFLMETPGETHTLVVPDDVDEMITWFHVRGGYTYFDSGGNQTGFEDVFTKLERARAHYAAAGVDAAVLQRLIC